MTRQRIIQSLLAIAVLALAAIAPAHAQSTWSVCAQEGGSCTLSAPKLMRYGQPWTPAWSEVRTLGPGTIPCTNAYWGDPSPGTGKRCEIMDAPAAPPPPPSGPLPPLTSGETYIVSWDAPTTNTDGSPIGTIVSTEVQASTSQDFATYYSWISSQPGATSVSVVNGPTGTVYWRARVTTADGTSDFSATAISERQWVSQTKPPCWPKPFGAGTWVKAAQNAQGFALYWQCTVDGKPGHHGFMGLWSNLEPDWMAQLSAAIEAGSFSALWDAKVTGPTQASTYDAVRPLWVALRDANPLPPAESWKVRPLTGSMSRPAYAVVNGARTTTVVGRVAIGAPCDCAAHRSGTSSSTYCAVTGQPNIATADPDDALAASAAICARAP